MMQQPLRVLLENDTRPVPTHLRPAFESYSPTINRIVCDR
jgi:hypothetical protein